MATNPITNLPYTPGELNILGMIGSCHETARTWSEFYITLLRTTSKSVASMPPHEIKIFRDTPGDTFTVTITGPFWNVKYTSDNAWTT